MCFFLFFPFLQHSIRVIINLIVQYILSYNTKQYTCNNFIVNKDESNGRVITNNLIQWLQCIVRLS